ncbi:hypothetical protein [Streptomyces antarcticus]|uniref:hypothetical protein n=1 Tax=Streptomyces antarcticus TaxID=2996458 RepID=UPI002271417F|nr:MULTISPECIES: hypothetical protein [unclassified Streptomyces]MCY0944110.1 hypothetical protein [Streptomyces sp. H34-AA3]MCZ4087649.1 hypothetical protein [Streptomyces sp. H34-S5]
MHPYIGSGPYCFSNSLAMALGEDAPSPSVIEVLTGSPFGFQLLADEVPLFDPFGWDPEIGLDSAIDVLGYTCERSDGGDADEALGRLRAGTERGPVLVGPMDMGLLLHQPGSGSATGADHYVVVLAVDGGTVVFHDPHGHPYATLPAAEFLEAWRGEEVAYLEEPFALRTSFARRREVSAHEALRASLPAAVSWLGVRDDRDVPPGSLANADGLERLADQVGAGELGTEIREMLEKFSVRVGARRLSDAAVALTGAGYPEPGRLLREQAALLGGLQYPLVTGDDAAFATGLRRLAPTYGHLREVLAKTVAGPAPSGGADATGVR